MLQKDCNVNRIVSSQALLLKGLQLTMLGDL
jgi:hypothetical protein